MRDGTFVLVAPGVPLPESARLDMEARVAAVTPATLEDSPEVVDAVFSNFSRLAQTLRSETGRAVVIIAHTVLPSTGRDRWVHFGGTARENIPAPESLTGTEVTVEEYQEKVFERSNEDYFDVFIR
jgi:hypothetical protein